MGGGGEWRNKYEQIVASVRKNERDWLRHRRSNCDSYLIHGYAEYILCCTTYEYRSIGQHSATIKKEIIGTPSHVYGYINYAYW